MVQWAEREINFDKKGQNGSKLKRMVVNKGKIKEWNRKKEKTEDGIKEWNRKKEKTEEWNESKSG